MANWWYKVSQRYERESARAHREMENYDGEN